MAGAKIFNAIDERLRNIDDDRIQLLFSGKLSEENFINLTRKDDPWVFVGGDLKLITKEERKSQIDDFLNYQKKLIKKTGGINPSSFFDKKDIWFEVYPELKDDVLRLEKEANLDPNCVGCSRGKKASEVLPKLFEIKYDGRNLSALNGIIPEYAFIKLKGEEIEVEKIGIEIPDFFNKREVNLLPTITRDFQLEYEQQTLVQNASHIVRESCKYCVIKHLAHFLRLVREVADGYVMSKGHTQHIIAEVELEHAIDECVKYDLELSKSLIEIKNNLYLNPVKEAIDKVVVILKDKFEFDLMKIDIIGRMSELGDLLISNNQEEAKQIREIRLKIMNQNT